MLSLTLLLSLVTAQRPIQSARLVPVPAWQPADVGEDACPYGSHLHALGTLLSDDPNYRGDGGCYSDDDDAPLLPKVYERPSNFYDKPFGKKRWRGSRK
jgi:hypothetical protein